MKQQLSSEAAKCGSQIALQINVPENGAASSSVLITLFVLALFRRLLHRRRISFVSYTIYDLRRAKHNTTRHAPRLQLQRSVNKLGVVVGKVTRLEELKGTSSKFVSTVARLQKPVFAIASSRSSFRRGLGGRSKP